MTISEGVAPATRTVLRVELEQGRELEASLGGMSSAAVLDDVLRQLESAAFVRLGDDTIVRSADVKSIRLRAEGAGLSDSLKPRLGGDHMSYDQQRGDTAIRDRTQDGQQQQPGIADQLFGYGNRPFAETKPFFMTSEFLAFLVVGAGVLIAAWQADNLDAPRAWLITSIVTAAYIVSRGFAKSGTRDPNPDRRHWQN